MPYADPENERIRGRRKYRRFKGAYAERRRAWRAADRRRVRCHSAVARAIRRGDLVRPADCPLCGETKRVDAHHPDYDKPLEVMWACRKCHLNLV